MPVIKVSNDWEWRKDDTNNEFGWHSRLGWLPSLPPASEIVGAQVVDRSKRLQLRMRRGVDECLGEEDERG